MRAFGKAPMRNGKPAHVWHCSLSLHPDEPAQTAETWQRITTLYMEVMGWDAQDQDEVPRRQAQHHGEARWLAQHHGLSKDGRDHIHIAANIVTEDGRQWNDYDDRVSSSRRPRSSHGSSGCAWLTARSRTADSAASSPASLKPTHAAD